MRLVKLSRSDLGVLRVTIPMDLAKDISSHVTHMIVEPIENGGVTFRPLHPEMPLPKKGK